MITFINIGNVFNTEVLLVCRDIITSRLNLPPLKLLGLCDRHTLLLCWGRLICSPLSNRRFCIISQNGKMLNEVRKSQGLPLLYKFHQARELRNVEYALAVYKITIHTTILLQGLRLASHNDHLFVTKVQLPCITCYPF